MAPSRYLGLPWPEWGETDAALSSALHTLDAMVCRCGCGQYMDESHDKSKDGRWQPRVATCYAGQALAEFRSDHADDLKPGLLVYLELLPEGESPVDPLAAEGYDPEQARRNYEEHQRKWGQLPVADQSPGQPEPTA